MTGMLKYEVHGSILTIRSEGFRASTLICDFSKAGFSPQVSDGLIRSMVALHLGHQLASVRIYWRSLKFLGVALRERGSEGESPIPKQSYRYLKKYLEKSRIGDRTCQALLKAVERMLRWCERNVPGVVPRDLDYLVGHFNLEKSRTVRTPPDEALVKKILALCYEGIESVEKRLAGGRQLMSDQSSDASPTSKILQRLVEIGDGRVPLQNQLTSGDIRCAGRLGGLSKLRAMVEPIQEDIFFFYLAILIQTSGNPLSILEMEVNAVERHPVRSDLERVVWSKRRSGRQQYADFPASKEWSAPNLVRRLLALNQHCRPFASEPLRNRLFLSANYGRELTVLSWQTLHNLLNEFIERNGIPRFHLKDLRASGAKLHHEASKSQITAQRRLNHAAISTTELYTPRGGLRRRHDAVILKFQGELIELGRKLPRPESARDSITHTETTFGFTCRDLRGGVAPGSRPGYACQEFLRCASCPNALVPVDDVAVVGRLLATVEAIDDARLRAIKQGWSPRFKAVYAPIREVIVNEILPRVSDGVRLKAESYAKCESIPYLD